jgi:hypothetical protein
MVHAVIEITKNSSYESGLSSSPQDLATHADVHCGARLHGRLHILDNWLQSGSFDGLEISFQGIGTTPDSTFAFNNSPGMVGSRIGSQMATEEASRPYAKSQKPLGIC